MSESQSWYDPMELRADVDAAYQGVDRDTRRARRALKAMLQKQEEIKFRPQRTLKTHDHDLLREALGGWGDRSPVLVAPPLGDNAAAEDLVTPVDDGGLAGSDGPDGLGEG